VPRTDKNGRMFAFVECEDGSGPLECTFFADAFAQYREFLKEGEIVWVRGRVDSWRDTHKILVNEARNIDEIRAGRIQAIEIVLPLRQITEASLTRLHEIVCQYKGRRKLWIAVREETGEIRVEAGNGHGIAPCSALIRALQDLDLVKELRFIVKEMNGNGRDED
jgi:DNA polymerase III alpha subunit